jgi:hypothetical protein
MGDQPVRAPDTLDAVDSENSKKNSKETDSAEIRRSPDSSFWWRGLSRYSRLVQLLRPSAEREELVTNPEKAGDRTLAGKCLCGAAHYAVADEFVYAGNCHCSNCRRATGSAFKPFAGIERDKLTIAGGRDNLMIYGDENGHDAHCKVCGSLLYSVVRDGAFVHVAMGTLIDDPTIRPTAHIFVGSKARWFTITDDRPQYEEHVVAARLRGGKT